LETLKSGGIFAVLWEARKSEVLDSSQNVHFPKMAVVNLIGFSRFSNQRLAVELLIAFPIRLRLAPAGRRNQFQLAVVRWQ
jgi:hypothetical protein